MHQKLYFSFRVLDKFDLLSPLSLPEMAISGSNTSGVFSVSDDFEAAYPLFMRIAHSVFVDRCSLLVGAGAWFELSFCVDGESAARLAHFSSSADHSRRTALQRALQKPHPSKGCHQLFTIWFSPSALKH